MKLQFLKRQSKNWRLLAAEQVVAGDMGLYVIVGNEIVIPVSSFNDLHHRAKSAGAVVPAEEVSFEIIGTGPSGIEYKRCGSYWNDPFATELLDFITGTHTFRLSAPETVALAILGERCLGPTVVLNERGETCHVFDHSFAEEKVDGTAVLGFTRVFIDENNLAVTPVSFAEKADRYPINTPEFAAVIDVWEKYWKSGIGMNQDAIVAELMAEKGFSRKRAEAIEMICRPLNKRRGGHNKIK